MESNSNKKGVLSYTHENKSTNKQSKFIYCRIFKNIKSKTVWQLLRQKYAQSPMPVIPNHTEQKLKMEHIKQLT